MTNVNTNENKFYNFIASASSYINDIRVVSPQNGKKKDAFVSVKVAILEGEKSDPSKHFADFIVRGDQAKAIIRAYKDHWPEFGKQNGWFAGIQIGSLYAKTYEHKGETKVTLSGRLLKFTYLQIGDTVIDLKAFEPAPQAQQPAPQAQQPAPQVQQPAPQVQQPVPQVQQPAPQVQQPAPQVQQPAPQVQQPAPQVQQPAPQVQQPAPQVQQPAPQVQQPAPQVQQPAPQVQQPAPQVPQPA